MKKVEPGNSDARSLRILKVEEFQERDRLISLLLIICLLSNSVKRVNHTVKFALLTVLNALLVEGFYRLVFSTKS